ncbi:MAG: hypothetical protein COX62_08190 [Deltaproteobacteria bacterium CG_4_10_14_0_2_um_filter_43_8]|nr:MAG: hypothetical protein COV43_07880 [Deltaproteobacteria bacterium CG11_big_fil_rev_8_21_14_0_20_42_23]PJA18769.1 MAG: hypothetical protein COX62_08190 [Deltaproteobacteria bacterium CG_4_10_14_0_2_um_filter_43_8]PJC63911.1 MAG: hypothetical protein CO021_07035 [Deltaproteobacteria bacterium CG_4_9_14_0_2_um_filter_42_21]
MSITAVQKKSIIKGILDMRQAVTWCLILNMFFQLQVFGIASAHAEKKISSLRVAVLPYAETLTPELDVYIKRVRKDLKQQREIEVLDDEYARSILDYYLTYVDESTQETNITNFVQSARQKYSELKYKEAKELIHQAKQAIQANIDAVKSNRFQIDILMLEAKLAYLEKNSSLIAKDYETIAHLDPSLTLEKGLYSRWEIKALATARDNILKEGTGTLSITAKPYGSEVYLNGLHVGTTLYDKPLLLKNIPLGQHCVELKTIHHKSYRTYVEVQKNIVKILDLQLERAVSSGKTKNALISPQHFHTPYELSYLMTQLGYYMKADKIILVRGKVDDQNKSDLFYQIGDTELGAVYKEHSIPLDKQKSEHVALVTKEMRDQLEKDLLKNPHDQLITQSVGSLKLHERRKQPLLKKPLFWILVGAGAATGGVGSILLGGSVAASTTGGIVIGL